MKENIKISIIIPVYNAEVFVDKCLKSVKSQTFKNFEVIVINDGSNDKSLEIINVFSEDSRFVIINQENQGVSKTRNKGLDLAKGQYICFVDSDDVLNENYLNNFIEIIDFHANKVIDVILQGIEYYYDDNKIITKSFKELKSNNFVDIFIFSEKNELNYSPFNKLIRNDIIKKNKIKFDEKLSFGEDYIFMLDVYLRSKEIAYSNNVGYRYVVTANMNSLSKKRLSFETLHHFAKKVRDKRKKLFQLHNNQFPLEYILYNDFDYYELLIRSINEHYLSEDLKNISKQRIQLINKEIPKNLKIKNFKHFDNKVALLIRDLPIDIQYKIIKGVTYFREKIRLLKQ
ncbi:glycosyltransferase [Empedobacter falsenii]